MSEYSRPETEAEYEINFAQKKPLMSDSEAYYESSRCLFCYDAPCVEACPTGIDIPLFIKQINTKNITGSADTIFDANWMGNACGKVCPTGVLCEGACVHKHQDVPVIQIGRLQNYATRHAMDNNKKLFAPGVDNQRSVAIIGAGPAGIACACELRTLGYAVDIYEKRSKPSGLTVYGVAPYKITNQEVLDEIEYLQNQLKFNIQYNSSISSKEDIQSLEHKYDAIFIGVGIGATAALRLEGEDKNGVVGAVEFIEELRMNKHNTPVADNVVVIGGGNTAMDAASESARMGASKVSLVYRRDKSSMSAYDFEYKLAVGAGVDSIFNAQPIAILGDQKVDAVRFIKTKNNNGKLEYVPGSEFDIPCSMVIKATGQAKQKALFDMIDDLDIDARHRIVVNEQFQTSNRKYFAGGDAVNGGAEVVNAAYDGKMAAKGIDTWLNG